MDLLSQDRNSIYEHIFAPSKDFFYTWQRELFDLNALN